MTREWDLPTKYLCDHTDERTDNNHLLGEHAEMHQEGGTLESHPHGEAVCRGHAKLGQVHTSKMKARHDELAKEMECRGFDHDSPFEYDIDVDIGYIDRHANLVDLYNRCEDCAARIDELGGFA